jgi:hypothetical protein
MDNDNIKDPQIQDCYSQGMRVFNPSAQKTSHYDPLPGENAREKSIYLYIILQWTKTQIAKALSISRPTLDKILLKNKQAYLQRLSFTLPKCYKSIIRKYFQAK